MNDNVCSVFAGDLDGYSADVALPEHTLVAMGAVS